MEINSSITSPSNLVLFINFPFSEIHQSPLRLPGSADSAAHSTCSPDIMWTPRAARGRSTSSNNEDDKVLYEPGPMYMSHYSEFKLI